MAGRGELRSILAGRGFARLYGTRLTGQFADGLFQASLAGSILFNPDRRTDPLEVALGFAVLLVPYSLVGPFAGVLLDRWSRRSVLVVANVVRATGVPVVALLVWQGRSGADFLVATLLIIGVNRFILSGLSASLPRVCATERLVTANSLSTTSGTIAYAVGGGAALLLRELIGSGNSGYAVLAVCAAPVYLASALLASGFARGALGPDAGERAARDRLVDVARGLVDGARHLAARRGAGYALLALSAHRIFYGVSTLATLLLYQNYFPDGPIFRTGLAGLGQAVVAGAAGALVAALVTPVATRRMLPRTWMTGLLLAAVVVEVVLGFPYTTETLVPAAFLLGIVAQGIKIVTDTAVQTECDDDFRGRVFSVYDTLFNLCYVGGLLIGAATLPATGKSYAVLALVAAGYAVVGGGYGLAAAHWARRRPAQRPPAEVTAA